MRDVALYLMIAINVISMIGMIAGILMHSGRGGGLSDMFGGGGGAALGSSAAERNLTRITTCFALVWIMSVVALTFLLAFLLSLGSRLLGRRLSLEPKRREPVVSRCRVTRGETLGDLANDLLGAAHVGPVELNGVQDSHGRSPIFVGAGSSCRTVWWPIARP